jgi:hypothetical protein
MTVQSTVHILSINSYTLSNLERCFLNTLYFLYSCRQNLSQFWTLPIVQSIMSRTVKVKHANNWNMSMRNIYAFISLQTFGSRISERYISLAEWILLEWGIWNIFLHLSADRTGISIGYIFLGAWIMLEKDIWRLYFLNCLHTEQNKLLSLLHKLCWNRNISKIHFLNCMQTIRKRISDG